MQRRITRRRLVQAGAGLGVAGVAASLLGCSSSDGDGSPSGGDASGLLHTPLESSSKAVPGGTFQWVDVNNIQSLDPFFGGFEATQLMYGYSRLVQFKAFKYPEPVTQTLAPDAATSWEVSPDGLTHTYKLRPGMKFDARPPTNGRVMTSADVKYSFDRFAGVSPIASQLMNDKEPTAPVVSWSTPNEQTFVIKTAFPYGPLNAFLANFRFITLIPTEADGQYNTKQAIRGSGAWLFQEFQAGSHIAFTKNPDWYDAAKVKLDGVNFASISEYATGIAQFRAGNLWTYPVAGEDILPLKSALPQLFLRGLEDFPISAAWFRFGYGEGSPFRDERVRQAASMLIDRDLFINTFGNVDKFEAAGLSVPARWHTAVPCGEEGLWLDPKSTKDFGENAKYFAHNPAEAKKLLRAAGYTQAIETTLTTRTDSPTQTTHAEVLAGMWESDGDFKIVRNVIDNRSDFTPNYTNGYNKHQGIAHSVAAAPPDVDSYLFTYYKSDQPRTGHLDSNGQPDKVMDDFLEKQRQATDMAARASVLKDFQRYAAAKMYLLPIPGAALGFELGQPWIGNFGVYRSRAGGGVGQETMIHHWFDASKKS